MSTDLICKMKVNIRDNNDDLNEEEDYTTWVEASIINGDKEECIIDTEYNPFSGEMEDFMNDEEVAEDFVELSGLTGKLSTSEMVDLLNITMDYVINNLIEEPLFQYDSVPLSYAPWSHSDSPPERLMPFCYNSAAGLYDFDVVRENGKIKII